MESQMSSLKGKGNSLLGEVGQQDNETRI